MTVLQTPASARHPRSDEPFAAQLRICLRFRAEARPTPPKRGRIIDMSSRTFVAACSALFVLTSITAVGCGAADPASDREEVSEAAAQSEPEETGRSESSLIIIPTCDPTAITADSTQSTPPGNCGVVQSTSLGDIYAEVFCNPYVVEFTYKPTDIAAGWDHAPWSQAECEAMRANYTLYTFNGSSWTTNGTAGYHGVWCTGDFCGTGVCNVVLNSGSVEPVPSNGTKWRVAATAFAKNCTDTCYNDFKRVKVSDFGNCVIP
jgi:hypothetical protein